jgi:TolB protein
MWKCVSFLLLPLFLLGQHLEVQLHTRSPLPPIYLSSLHGNPLAEEMRAVLEFDLNAGGLGAVISGREDLEASPFDLAAWRKAKIPFCVTLRLLPHGLEVTAFNIEQGSSKKYGPIPLHRKEIHRLADALHKDLFGKEGIASLRLIYAHRSKNKTKEGLDYLSEIWVSDADGANAKQVTFDHNYCLSPFFIPNRADAFGYVSEKSGQSKIYRASLSHPESELMVDLRGNQALPALSKRGNQLAFITDAAGRPDLFIQHFDSKGRAFGKARQLYSAPRATQATPTFSPDGKKVAFVSDKDGPPRIYVLSVMQPKEKVRPQLITKVNRENTSPCWSPDGTKLAYSAKVDGVRQIWVYDFETDQETPLTSGPETKENPSWAPDSFHLVYNTESEESSELYLVHLNQGEPLKISSGPGQKRFASWEPR